MKPNPVFFLILLFCTSAWASPKAFAQEPQVLASVHPLALVAASVVPSENLRVLLPPGMTPHDFSLRPSDLEQIQNADIIIWAGAQTEPYLASFVKRWPEKKWLDVSTFAPASAPKDTHWWFSVRTMIGAQKALAQIMGKDSSDFASHTQAALQEAKRELEPVKELGFFVFHQAYDHFVQEVGLNQLGAFTLSPERKPGAKTLESIRQQLAAGKAVCVFSEPEYSPALVESVLKGSQAKRGELDPMAAHIALTPNGYAVFIRDLTARFKDCLSANS